MTTIERRVALQERPVGRPAMFHQWRALTFLHWSVDASALQRLVPDGLTIDTFEGKAYVGLVPFTMQGIRLNGLPALPGFRSSHETNVRTYVVDEQGIPGVWFFSLDAENPVFVEVARAWYHLPYVHARMDVEQEPGTVRYHSLRRFGALAECHVEASFEGVAMPAVPGTLEFFLVERYVLFAHCRGRLNKGRVWHEPYQIQPVSRSSVKENLIEFAHISLPESEPIALYSPGVDVDVFRLQP